MMMMMMEASAANFCTNKAARRADEVVGTLTGGAAAARPRQLPLPSLILQRRRQLLNGSAVQCIIAQAAAAAAPAGRLPNLHADIINDARTLAPLAAGDHSLARQNYSPVCEAAVNHQIGLHYNVSYTYLVLFAYFDRDNVALPGFAMFFEECSIKERARVKKLMKYQTTRGGKVLLSQVHPPPMTEFNDTDRGDALHAMEYTLALTKVVNRYLLDLQKVASEEGDPQLRDFIEKEFLHEEVENIKMISKNVSQLRRTGEGHGVYHVDQLLRGII